MSEHPASQLPDQPPLRPTEPRFLPYQGNTPITDSEHEKRTGTPVSSARERERAYATSRRAPAGARRAGRVHDLGSPGEWMWVLLAALLLGATIIFSLGLFFVLQATQNGDGDLVAEGPLVEPTSAIYGVGGIVDESGAEGQAVGGLLGNEGQSMLIHRWDGQERFTMLLMGMDKRPGESGVSFRTDTMILVSLDPATEHVGMLSIPRDLYVDVPGYGVQRINTAYGLGELAQIGGGPRLAMQTVQYNFGIPVNDYAVIDFNTFIHVIDMIGGITVQVESPIYDAQYPDMNYGYDPFYLEAGEQQLDGLTALKYARSRHGSDDIDRARRQQQVLYAVRDKILALDMLPQLALEAPVLWSEFDAGVDTGLALDQVLQLAWWFKDIPAQNFSNGVVGWEYVIAQNWQGQDILVPNRGLIGNLMVQVFGVGYNPYR